MPGFGYDDWVRRSTNFAYAQIDDIRLATMAGHNFGLIYMGGWQYVRIGFFNDDGIAVDTIQVTWTDDAAGLIPAGRNTIVIGPGDQGGTTLPVLAPFIGISYSSNVNATASTRILVYGTSSDGTKALHTDTVNYLLAGTAPNLAANGSTPLAGMAFWYTGWAQVMAVTGSGGPAFLVLSHRTTTGANVQHMQVGASSQATAMPQYVFMPPNPNFYQIFNGSTAQIVQIAISPAPR
jgi:hypothetical protein